MLIRVTEEEAFQKACAAANTYIESAWALNLRAGEDLKDVFYDSLSAGRADSPEFVAVCTYFAVKAGTIVMREATYAEKSAYDDDMAAACQG